MFRISDFEFRILTSLLILLFLSPTAYALSLTDAQKEYLSRNYEEAIAKAERLRETDQVLYFLGLAHIKINAYSEARQYLRKLIKRFPDSYFYGRGLIKLADTYFFQKDYQEAGELYRQMKDESAAAECRPLVFLRLAQVSARQGDWPRKKEYIKLLKGQYPKSPEAEFARILDSYGDFFTIQVGAFSEKKNALGLLNELNADYKAYIVKDKKGGYLLYKVRVGKFKTRYDVEKTAAQLRDQGYPASIYP